MKPKTHSQNDFGGDRLQIELDRAKSQSPQYTTIYQKWFCETCFKSVPVSHRFGTKKKYKGWMCDDCKAKSPSPALLYREKTGE